MFEIPLNKFEKGVIELQKQIVLKFLSGSVEWYENFDTIKFT